MSEYIKMYKRISNDVIDERSAIGILLKQGKYEIGCLEAKLEKSPWIHIDDRAIEYISIGIVNRINENVGTTVAVRQSTNDVNFNETIARIKQFLQAPPEETK